MSTFGKLIYLEIRKLCMFEFRNIQLNKNKLIAQENKKIILRRLEEYYMAINYSEQIKAKEFAILMFWQAKKQGRLDNLNRIIK